MTKIDSVIGLEFNNDDNMKVEKHYIIFAIWFAFSFILNGYASGLPGLSIGSLVFVVMVVLSIIRRWRLSTSNGVLTISIVLLSFSFIGMILNSSSATSFSTHIIGVCKFLLWTLMVSNVASQRYKFDYILKYIKFFGYIMIIYLVIQNIGFYLFHIYFPNIFNFLFLKPYAEGYADYEILTNTSILRPGSLLSESSFIGNYLLCMLAMVMEEGVRKNSDTSKEIIIISIAIILTSSTSAMTAFPIIWIVYWNKMRGNNKSKILVLCMIVIFLVALVLTISPQLLLGNFASSMHYSVDKFSRLDTMTRFGKSFEYLQYLKGKEIIFGVGIGNDDLYLLNKSGGMEIYLNSVTSLIASTGLLGFGSFLVFIVHLFRRIINVHNKLALSLLIIYFSKGFAGGMYFSTYGVMFMFVICGELISDYYDKTVIKE